MASISGGAPSGGPTDPLGGAGPGTVDGAGSFSVRKRRSPWSIAVGAVVLVAGLAVGGWYLLDDGFDGPSADEDRAGLVRALRTAAAAASLEEVPDAVQRIEEVSVVADRGSCDGAPADPPGERTAATMVYRSPTAGPAPLSLAAGAFTFTSTEQASRFARSVDENLAVCAISATPVDVPPVPSGSVDAQTSHRITVELASLAGLRPELQLTVARRNRVVVVAAGIDAAGTDAFAAAAAADAATRLEGAGS